MLGQVARKVTKDCSAWLSMGGGRGKNILVWNNKVNVQSFKGLKHMLPMPYNTVSTVAVAINIVKYCSYFC